MKEEIRIGDKVWYMDSNKPEESKVYGIIHTNAHRRYLISNASDFGDILRSYNWKRENELFSTKELLLKSL